VFSNTEPRSGHCNKTLIALVKKIIFLAVQTPGRKPSTIFTTGCAYLAASIHYETIEPTPAQQKT
jgi:hypothetical protein